MALLTLGKNIMTIENAKGPILVNMLFWGGEKLPKWPKKGKLRLPMPSEVDYESKMWIKYRNNVRNVFRDI